MPRRKMQRKTKRTKKYRKVRRNKASIVSMKTPGFADSVFVKLKYAENFQLGNGASSVLSFSWRGNSLYDPSYTSPGHQPMYYDQYSAIYGRYRVLGSKIVVRCINGAGDLAQYVVLQAGTDLYSTSSITTILEQSKGAISKIVSRDSQSPSYIKMYQSTRKACGLTKTEAFGDHFSADTGNNPQQIWYWNLSFGTINGTSPVSMYFIATITYYCQFYDRLNAVQS